MTDDRFIEPAETDFLETFGAERVPLPDSVGAFRVRIDSDPENALELTYDVIARSVRIRWTRGTEPVADLYREQVSRLSVGGDGVLTVLSGVPELASELTVAVYPIRISDVQLAR
ncbi:hypothetical protein [Nocardia sp. NPDC057353]|uniref:hypothetical protein n=1 Tax=Nocardia sp. NPDC057353 TaxID=3346104 RepID=UPI00363D0BE8